MPGRPFLRAFRAKLKDNGGWTAIFERIASGQTLTVIAKDYACSVSWLCHQLRDNPERRAIYEAARKDAALSLVERGLQAIEDAPIDRDALTKAKLLSDYTWRMATKYDREQFGDPVEQGVTVNIGELYVSALQERAKLQHITSSVRVIGSTTANPDSTDAKGTDVEPQVSARA